MTPADSRPREVESPSNASAQRSHHPGAKKLGVILAIVVAGFMASLAFHYEMGAVKKQPYPLSTFLFRPHDQFSDFYISPTVAASFSLSERTRVQNVGWGSVVIMCHTWIRYTFFYPEYEFASLVLYTCGFLGALFWLVRRTLGQVSVDCLWAKTFALTLCTYPVLISLDRSNQENAIFVMVALAFLVFYPTRLLWSAVLLGVAISAKPYAAIFLPVFVADRRFKEIFIALGTAAGVTLFALLIMPGTMMETLHAVQGSMASYVDIYVAGNEGMYFNGSLHGMAKTLIYLNHWFLSGADALAAFNFMRSFSSGYFVFALVSFAFIFGITVLLRAPLWKKLALLSCCINLLPYNSGAYRMMYLFLPILLFLREDETGWGDRFFAVIFGLILIPKSYLHFVFDPVFRVNPLEVADQVVLDPLLLSALLLGVSVSILRNVTPSETSSWLWSLYQGARFPNRPAKALV